jgi:hypothetical protein
MVENLQIQAADLAAKSMGLDWTGNGMNPPCFYLYRNGAGLKVETLKQNRVGSFLYELGAS